MKLLSLLLCIGFLCTGMTCRNPERTTLTAAKVETTTVIAAMQAFVQYEKTHGASSALRQQVDIAYQKVRAANLAAEQTWLTYRTAAEAGSPDAPKALVIYQTALSVVATASAELITLINSLTK